MSGVIISIAIIVVSCGLYIGGHIKGYTTLQVQVIEMQTQAIKRGYALYCPTDDSVQHKGKFAWNGECDK